MDGVAAHLYNSNMTLSQIQNFDLFGETSNLPDVVHCETIEARSTLHDWEFAPHRHARLHQVLLVATGGGRLVVEDRAVPLTAGSLVNMPTGAVHGFSFQPGTSGWVVTLAVEMLDEVLSGAEGVRAALASPFVGTGGAGITAVMRAIFGEYEARNFARAHVLRALSAQLTGLVARQIAGQAAIEATGEDPLLLRRFDALLEAHFPEHWRVSAYAAALSISQTHLSRLTRRATGQSASRRIETRLLREARRMLIYTNLPVSQIAYALGFNDPAYFSRVFSRGAGVSPRQFRARANTGQGDFQNRPVAIDRPQKTG